MIGNIVKLIIGIGAFLQIIAGFLMMIGIFNITESFGGMFFGGVMIVWGLFILAGLTKLHERKR